jgi:hypothetical protein
MQNVADLLRIIADQYEDEPLSGFIVIPFGFKNAERGQEAIMQTFNLNNNSNSSSHSGSRRTRRRATSETQSRSNHNRHQNANDGGSETDDAELKALQDEHDAEIMIQVNSKPENSEIDEQVEEEVEDEEVMLPLSAPPEVPNSTYAECEWLDGDKLLRFEAPYDRDAILLVGWATYVQYSKVLKEGGNGGRIVKKVCYGVYQCPEANCDFAIRPVPGATKSTPRIRKNRSPLCTIHNEECVLKSCSCTIVYEFNDKEATVVHTGTHDHRRPPTFNSGNKKAKLSKSSDGLED